MEFPTGSTIDQKLDVLMASMATLLKGQETITHLVTKVNTIEAKVNSHDGDIAGLKKEICLLKESVNTSDLEARSCAIRIFNYPMIEGETLLSNKIYDRIVKPILQAAKEDGEIPTVPTVHNVIEAAFRVGRPTFHPDGKPKAPPPVLVRFVNKRLRLATLIYKKHAPPTNDSERALGCRRFVLVEDLSPATYKKLREVSGDDRVERAWTAGGQIRFVLKGEDKSIRLVKSPFDSVDHIVFSSKVKS
jgi:hypothetical protein